jgi:hypothetical protein
MHRVSSMPIPILAIESAAPPQAIRQLHIIIELIA